MAGDGILEIIFYLGIVLGLGLFALGAYTKSGAFTMASAVILILIGANLLFVQGLELHTGFEVDLSDANLSVITPTYTIVTPANDSVMYMISTVLFYGSIALFFIGLYMVIKTRRMAVEDET